MDGEDTSDDLQEATIKFVPRADADHPRLLLAEKKSSDKTCEHHQSLIDAKARIVECADCGVSLDPIAVLAGLAKTGMRLESRRQEIRDYHERELRKERLEIDESKKAVPSVIDRLKVGDKIRVHTERDGRKFGTMNGMFQQAGDGKLVITEERYREEIDVESIYHIRVLRKAVK